QAFASALLPREAIRRPEAGRKQTEASSGYSTERYGSNDHEKSEVLSRLRKAKASYGNLRKTGCKTLPRLGSGVRIPSPAPFSKPENVRRIPWLQCGTK